MDGREELPNDWKTIAVVLRKNPKNVFGCPLDRRIG